MKTWGWVAGSTGVEKEKGRSGVMRPAAAMGPKDQLEHGCGWAAAQVQEQHRPACLKLEGQRCDGSGRRLEHGMAVGEAAQVQTSRVWLVMRGSQLWCPVRYTMVEMAAGGRRYRLLQKEHRFHVFLLILMREPLAAVMLRGLFRRLQTGIACRQMTALLTQCTSICQPGQGGSCVHTIRASPQLCECNAHHTASSHTLGACQ
jgi:hypothetical protein